MVKIGIVDTLCFRKSIISEQQLLAQEFKPVREAILDRFKIVEQRIAEATDPAMLQGLDSGSKFLKSVSQQFDAQMMFINRITADFETIDETFWNTIINGQKMADEIRFLKATIQDLQKQRDFATDGWRAERNRWNKGRILMKTT